MGVTLNSNKSKIRQAHMERINNGYNVLYAARGIGTHQTPVTPIILSKVYWSIAMSKMLYGIQVTPLSEKATSEFETAHRKMCKIVQQLPQNVPNPAPLATIGWHSIESHVAILKLTFMWTTLCLPVGNIYKTFLVNVLFDLVGRKQPCVLGDSPIKDMYVLCIKYKIDNLLIQNLKAGYFGSKNQRKKLIKEIVIQNEYEKWRVSCMLYGQLSMYSKTTTRITIHPWWVIANKIPKLTKEISAAISILMGCQPKGIQRNLANGVCKICDAYKSDSATHVLFECSSLKRVRDMKWQHAINSMPDRMSSHVESLSKSKLTELIASCYHESYVFEWLPLYIATASFIYSMYSERARCYDALG
jgi:hypothetical protein